MQNHEDKLAPSSMEENRVWELVIPMLHVQTKKLQKDLQKQPAAAAAN